MPRVSLLRRVKPFRNGLTLEPDPIEAPLRTSVLFESRPPMPGPLRITQQSGTASPSITLNTPASAAVGDVAYAYFWTGSGFHTMPTVPSGWTELASSPIQNSPGRLRVYRTKFTSAPAANYTWTMSSTFDYSAILVVVPNAELDEAAASAVTSVSGTTHTAGSVTALGSDRMALTVFASEGAGSVSFSSNRPHHKLARQVQGGAVLELFAYPMSAGSLVHTATVSASSTGVAHVVVLPVIARPGALAVNTPKVTAGFAGSFIPNETGTLNGATPKVTAALAGSRTAPTVVTGSPQQSEDDASAYSFSGSTPDIINVGATEFFAPENPANAAVETDAARFILSVPANSQITSASVALTATLNNSGGTITRVIIRGQIGASPSAFSTIGDFNSRARTTASVVWDVPSVTQGNVYNTPNLAPILQEIVNSAGYTPGAIVLFFETDPASDARRIFAPWDHPTFAEPVLTVTYSSGTSGTIASTVPKVTASFAGSRTLPAITGALSVNSPKLTASFAGSRTVPAFSGALSVNTPKVTADFTGSRTIPAISGSFTVNTPKVNATFTGSRTVPPISGALAVNSPKVTVAFTGNRTVPAFSGTFAMNTPRVTASFAGSRTVPNFSGSFAVNSPKVTASFTGSRTIPPISGSLVVNTPKVTAVLTGNRTVPAFTGSLAVNTPKVTSSFAGARTLPAFTGSFSINTPTTSSAFNATHIPPSGGVLAATSPKAVAAFTGNRTVPAFTAALNVSTPKFTASLVGSRTVPAFSGSLAANSPRVIASLTASRTVPAFTGAFVLTTPKVASSLTGNRQVPAFSGSLTTSTPKITSSLTATRAVPALNAVLGASTPGVVAIFQSTFSQFGIPGCIDLLITPKAVIGLELLASSIEITTAPLGTIDLEVECCQCREGGSMASKTRRYYVGDTIRIRASTRNFDTNALTDPTGLTVRVTPPTGAVVSEAWPGNVIKDAQGVFHLDYPVTLVGKYLVKVTGTGAVAAANVAQFEVWPDA